MKSKRSPCPIACTLDIIGDKWTLLVIRDLFLGRKHFKEFAQSPEKIATNILSNRLARLVESGIAERYPSEQHLGRDAYRLTPKGRSLGPVLKSVAKWGTENILGTAALMKPQ
jgi:DNA-binding HxlR family transcriptional regulator